MNSTSTDAAVSRARGRRAAVIGAGLIGMTLLSAGPARAADLIGTVTDVDGKPVASAMVTLEASSPDLGTVTETRFTNDKGEYRHAGIPDDAMATHYLRVYRLGYQQMVPPPGHAVLESMASQDGEHARVDVQMRAITNLAQQAPASAWFAAMPDTQVKENVVLQCVGCHQFPSPKVRGYGAALDGLDEQGKLASWRAMIQYMRVKFFEIGPDESLFDPAHMSYDVISDSYASLFDETDEKEISEYLAAHFPTRFDHLQNFEYGAPLGVGPDTRIREIQLPDSSFVREIALSEKSQFLWGADLQKNALLRVHPETGEQKAYPVPFDGPTGPHTLIDDPDGGIWVTMIENGVVAKFDPAAEEWKVYDKFGKFDMAHDLAPNHRFQTGYDTEQQVWLTMIGTNKLGRLDPATGNTELHELPGDDTKSALRTALYGAVMNRDGTEVWFSQLSGGIGGFNTVDKELVHFEMFPQGDGPRRIAIDGNDVIYVPLFGAGELYVFDTRAKKEVARVALPDRNSAPYSAVWDPWREVVWIGTSNGDVIYSYEPESKAFKVFPLPRRMAYLRMIAFDRSNGDLWTTYSNIPTGSGPSQFVLLSPGDNPDMGSPAVAQAR